MECRHAEVQGCVEARRTKKPEELVSSGSSAARSLMHSRVLLLAGWRHMEATMQRTRKDWAERFPDLVDVYHTEAEKIRLVLDNLNAHAGASL
jgi:hypothetical protein